MLNYVMEVENKRSAVYDGDKEVGRCTYIENADSWDLNSNVVDPDYRGQGIARKLVDVIADHARENDIKLAASCPYVVNLFENKKEEYEDVIL